MHKWSVLYHPMHLQIKQMLIGTGAFADTVPCHIASGLGAGFLAVCVGSPVDVVKSRMMGKTECYPVFCVPDMIAAVQVSAPHWVLALLLKRMDSKNLINTLSNGKHVMNIPVHVKLQDNQAIPSHQQVCRLFCAWHLYHTLQVCSTDCREALPLICDSWTCI